MDDRYELEILISPIETYIIKEPYRLFGDKKKGKKPIPKRKGGQDRARRQKRRKPRRGKH